MTNQKVSSVVLADVTEEFKRTQKIGSHAVPKKPDEWYMQPHVYVTAHYVCMRVAGWSNVDFDTLMTVSGASLLFAYHPDSMMPKYAHVWIDMDKRIAEATGFGWERVKFEGVDEAWKLVTNTIDSGRLGKAHYWEDMLIAGYQDAPANQDRSVFVMGDPFPGDGEW